jgi:hypothetical protein
MSVFLEFNDERILYRGNHFYICTGFTHLSRSGNFEGYL